MGVIRTGVLPLVIAAACAACAACAQAGPPAPPAYGMNGGAEGRRELQVFISPAGEPFRAEPGQPYPSAAWFARTDTDHDGKLSGAEFMADADSFFRHLDANHDNIIDGFEAAAYEDSLPEIAPRIRGLRNGEGMDTTLGRREGSAPLQLREEPLRRLKKGEKRRQGAALFSFLDDPQPLAAIDTDFDSKITLDEFHAAMQRRFAQLDVDRNGSLTLAEMPKPPVQVYAEELKVEEAKRKAEGRPEEPRGGHRRGAPPQDR